MERLVEHIRAYCSQGRTMSEIEGRFRQSGASVTIDAMAARASREGRATSGAERFMSRGDRRLGHQDDAHSIVHAAGRQARRRLSRHRLQRHRATARRRVDGEMPRTRTAYVERPSSGPGARAARPHLRGQSRGPERAMARPRGFVAAFVATTSHSQIRPVHPLTGGHTHWNGRFTASRTPFPGPLFAATTNQALDVAMK